jgi:hypothetical protein
MTGKHSNIIAFLTVEIVPYDAVHYPGGIFSCNICKKRGAGPVFRCSACNYDVHPSCVNISSEPTFFLDDMASTIKNLSANVLKDYLSNPQKVISIFQACESTCAELIKNTEAHEKLADDAEVSVTELLAKVGEEKKNLLERKKELENLKIEVRDRIEIDIAAAGAPDVIQMNVRGDVFWAEKTDLLKSGNSYFAVMLMYPPTYRGQYMINR